MQRMVGASTKTNLQDIDTLARGSRTKGMDMEERSRQQPYTKATLWVIRRKGSGY